MTSCLFDDSELMLFERSNLCPMSTLQRKPQAHQSHHLNRGYSMTSLQDGSEGLSASSLPILLKFWYIAYSPSTVLAGFTETAPYLRLYSHNDYTESAHADSDTSKCRIRYPIELASRRRQSTTIIHSTRPHHALEDRRREISRRRRCSPYSCRVLSSNTVFDLAEAFVLGFGFHRFGFLRLVWQNDVRLEAQHSWTSLTPSTGIY